MYMAETSSHTRRVARITTQRIDKATTTQRVKDLSKYLLLFIIVVDDDDNLKKKKTKIKREEEEVLFIFLFILFCYSFFILEEITTKL